MTGVAPLLRAEGISVRRGGRLLLDGVSFAAAPAAILGIIGPNGAGKTTLFAAVAGFVPLASGRVERNAELFYLPDGIRPWPDQRVGWCLDFFAGSGTLGAVASKVNRHYVLIDSNAEACDVMRKRLHAACVEAHPHPTEDAALASLF